MLLKRFIDLGKLHKMIRTTLGMEKPDLIIKGGNIVDVVTGSIYKGDIAIKDEFIVLVSSSDLSSINMRGENIIDADNCYILPGLIDSHTHIESSMLVPSLFSYYLLREGTTTAVVDLHEVANVAGLTGIKVLLKDMETTPFKFILQVPSCVPPVPELNESGDVITLNDIKKLIDELSENVIGLGEVMSYARVLEGDDEILNKISFAYEKGIPIDGHAADIRGRELQAYVLPKILTEHSARRAGEIFERLRCGLYVQIQKRAFEIDFKNIIEFLSKISTHRTMWCTDDAEADEIVYSNNTVRSIIKEAIELGLDPVKAIQMATVNIAQAYKVDTDIGIIAPGRYADLVIVKSIRFLEVRTVIANGKVILHEGEMIIKPPKPHHDLENFRNVSLKIHKQIKPIDLVPQLNIGKGSVLVNVLTVDRTVERERLQVEEGIVKADPAKDVIWVSVIERHGKSNDIGKGFLKGTGMREGAFASSVSHDSHNILVIGTSIIDMYVAFKEIVKIGGGLILVKNNHVISIVPLPYFGLLSAEPTLPYSLRTFKEHLKLLGVKVPLKKLLFLTLTVGRGGYGITTKGIIEYKTKKKVPEVEAIIENT